jgi:large-conductance mechanosensitive channel
MREEIGRFLGEANVIGLALAGTVGGAAGAVVKSMIDSLPMPTRPIRRAPRS